MLEGQGFEDILERMLSEVDDRLDKREGSIIYDALAPIALELANFYVSLGIALDESFADTASYYYLIKRAAERGLFPKEETRAALRMSVSPADAEIEAGDRFSLNGLNYSVVGPIEGDDGAYQVECETAGSVGNQQLGRCLPLETANELNGLEGAELTETLIPGEDEEDVEAFRERYFSSFNSRSFGGNQADYKKKVNELDGVGGCKVTRAWENGFFPSSFIPTDGVDAWYRSLTVTGEAREWIDAVYSAASERLFTVGGTVRVTVIDAEFKKPSAALLSRVQEALDPDRNAGEGVGLAPIGHVVGVVGVDEKAIDVSASITYGKGNSFALLEDAICQVIDGYFKELSRRWEGEESVIVRVSELDTRLMKVKGVNDIANIRLNGVGANLTLAENEIPVRGIVDG